MQIWMTGCLRQVNYKQPVAQIDYVLMNISPVSVIIALLSLVLLL